MKNSLINDTQCRKNYLKINVKHKGVHKRNSDLPKRKRDRRHSNITTVIPHSDSSTPASDSVNNEKQPSREILEPNYHSSGRECLSSDKEKEQETREFRVITKTVSKNCYNLHQKSSNTDEDSKEIWDCHTADVNNIRKEKCPSLGICGRPDGNSVFNCGQCGKTFKTKYTLSIHLKMPDHTEKRPFVCNVCGKGFRLSSTLCRHKIIHTDRKPYCCPNCEKSFNRSSTLKTHMRTHNEQKAFVCDICGKGFHQKGNLRNHVFVHTGEKPFKCSECDRAFNKMSNLKFHMHTHSDNMPHCCKICRKRFLKKAELKQHIKEIHS